MRQTFFIRKTIFNNDFLEIIIIHNMDIPPEFLVHTAFGEIYNWCRTFVTSSLI